MYEVDNRPKHVGWIETALKAGYADLPSLRIYAQSHFGPPDRIAFVVVLGVDEDRDRRRAIRSDAVDLLRYLGYLVEFEPGRDVYEVLPHPPESAHEKMQMHQFLCAARRILGE
ncbi:hypothetical protein K1T73_10540 [Roseovarius sp. SCSIO 43702]|uniref:hypothetical protein n=1 Tax=Roseovarius sp. SCSIO 43702 TaxID=2823043 RepID=UPI001C729DC9|nr:hypothetical protein [Roseovarius sp. SCSIO 43702]QYX55537.1 hypothetical protein K1T73_10540 [Roseovarius sp. SCSIO 43702]